jgi:hypothetical protein
MLVTFHDMEEHGEVTYELAHAAYSFGFLCRADHDAPCVWARTLQSDAYDWLLALSMVPN